VELYLPFEEILRGLWVQVPALKSVIITPSLPSDALDNLFVDYESVNF